MNDVISTKKVMMMKIAKSIAMKTIMLIMMVLVTASYSYSYSSSIGRTIRPWSQQLNHNYYRPLSTTTYTTSKKITNLFSTTDTSTSTTTDITTSTIRLSSQHLTQLRTDGYVSIPNFLPTSLTSIIRKDINNLRDKNNNRDDNGTCTTLFKKAGIGAGSSNKLNEEVRFAETCFLSMKKGSSESGDSLDKIYPNEGRDLLREVLNNVRIDLESPTKSSVGGRNNDSPVKLEPSVSELLYAYYPQGGYYRKHIDANRGSSTFLRSYSLLLYLNKDWTREDGGHLRIHSPSDKVTSTSMSTLNGDDEDGDISSSSSSSPSLSLLPKTSTATTMIDIEPRDGTLLLFKSDLIPHEVLNTNSERYAVVGWYNRRPTLKDVGDIAGDGVVIGGSSGGMIGMDPKRIGLLMIASGLVAGGVFMIVLGG